MSDQQHVSGWVYGIAFAAVLIGIKAIVHYAPTFHFGAVSDSMEGTTVTATITSNQTGVEFVVNNQSSYGYIDLTLECAYLGVSGTEIERQTIILYEKFEPEALQTVSINKIVIPGQAAELQCVSEDATVTSQISCGYHTKNDGSGGIDKTCSKKPIS